MSSGTKRPFDTTLLLAAFVLTSVAHLPIPVRDLEFLCVVALTLLLVAIWTKDVRLIAPIAFCPIAALSIKFNPWPIWPAHLLVPLLAYGLIVVPVPALWRAARIPVGAWPARATVWLIVVTVVGSAIALIVWHQFLHPDLGDLLVMIPAMPALLLPLACLGFAIVNAIIEELIWRGIIWDMLAKATSKAPLAIGLQAVSFGLFHIHGFPRGAIGVAMATVYGVFLGVIRHRTRGLGAVVVTHIFADIVIFVILITLAPKSA